jgi:hypothetical protein
MTSSCGSTHLFDVLGICTQAVKAKGAIADPVLPSASAGPGWLTKVL